MTDPALQLEQMAAEPPMSEVGRRRIVGLGSPSHDVFVQMMRESDHNFGWDPRAKAGERITPQDLPPINAKEGEEPPAPMRDWIHVVPQSRRILAYGDAKHPLILNQEPGEDDQYPDSPIPGTVIAENVVFYSQHPDDQRVMFSHHRLYKDPKGLGDLGTRIDADAREIMYEGDINHGFGRDMWADQTYDSGSHTVGFGTRVVADVDLSDPTTLRYREANILCDDPYAIIDAYDIQLPDASGSTTSVTDTAQAI